MAECVLVSRWASDFVSLLMNILVDAVLDVVNSAALKRGGWTCPFKSWFSPDLRQGWACWITWELDNYCFKGSPHCCPSHCTHPFTSLPAVRRTACPTTLPAAIIFVDLWHAGHFEWDELIPWCSFELHFPIIVMLSQSPRALCLSGCPPGRIFLVGLWPTCLFGCLLF